MTTTGGHPPAKRRAAVLGKPVAHSLSPVIHNAGYAAAGLAGWTYHAHECGEDELAGFVATLDAGWAGLSLTMPLKEVALRVADEVSATARALGAANTLYRRQDRWYAENTDAPGMVDALGWAGVRKAERIAVLGAGGTARAAVAACRGLGAAELTVYARRREAIERLRPVAEWAGVQLLPREWPGGTPVVCDLLISTVPAGAADEVAGALRGAGSAPVVFDVIYHPWPTALAKAAEAAGLTAVGGLDLLLAQAARQFELYTGVPAPVPAMRDALHAAAR